MDVHHKIKNVLYPEYIQSLEKFMNTSLIFTGILIAAQFIMVVFVIAVTIFTNVKKLGVEMDKMKTLVRQISLRHLMEEPKLKELYMKSEFVG